MKIVVKGVMTVEDALASVRHGVDGISKPYLPQPGDIAPGECCVDQTCNI